MPPSRLRHPNIAVIFDTGYAEGFHYCVMDYVAGQPLDAFISGRRPLVDETLRLLHRICEAVSAASSGTARAAA